MILIYCSPRESRTHTRGAGQRPLSRQYAAHFWVLDKTYQIFRDRLVCVRKSTESKIRKEEKNDICNAYSSNDYSFR